MGLFLFVSCSFSSVEEYFYMKRFITLSVFGFIYHGPSGHYFYNWLDKQIVGTEGKQVFMKVAIDQLFWCPIFMSRPSLLGSGQWRLAWHYWQENPG